MMLVNFIKNISLYIFCFSLSLIVCWLITKIFGRIIDKAAALSRKNLDDIKERRSFSLIFFASFAWGAFQGIAISVGTLDPNLFEFLFFCILISHNFLYSFAVSLGQIMMLFLLIISGYSTVLFLFLAILDLLQAILLFRSSEDSNFLENLLKIRYLVNLLSSLFLFFVLYFSLRGVDPTDQITKIPTFFPVLTETMSSSGFFSKINSFFSESISVLRVNSYFDFVVSNERAIKVLLIKSIYYNFQYGIIISWLDRGIKNKQNITQNYVLVLSLLFLLFGLYLNYAFLSLLCFFILLALLSDFFIRGYLLIRSTFGFYTTFLIGIFLSTFSGSFFTICFFSFAYLIDPLIKFSRD